MVISCILASDCVHARLRVHAVQFALLLRTGVVDTSPSLSLMQTWQVRGLRLLPK